MSGKKKVLMGLVMLLLIGSVAAGVVWNVTHYVMVGFRFYPKDARYLDLRDREISVRHYETLCRKLPECEVDWNVPLSGGAYPQDAEQITITTLTDGDVETLDYLTGLKVLQAEGCTDYDQLFALRQRRPELQIYYTVSLGGEQYPQDAAAVELASISPEEILQLRGLPELKTVIFSGADTQNLAALQEYCHSNGLEFGVRIGGKAILDTAKTVSVEAVTDEELALLPFLTNLERLHVKSPKASAKSLMQLRTDRPDVQISWEKEICGVLCSTEEEELDLSGADIRDLEAVETAMAYFPDARKVFLGECGVENETLAAFRDQVRADYKVVWTVQCGEKLKARTDDTTFMPVRERVYYFNDEEAYNLRYCEDMVCIDIGHMSIHDIEFVKYMPNLEYLILAHTQVQYIEPIRSCKKLKFLELDWTPIRDYSPLVDCTALEDLNLGNTYADSEPIGKMTWLKNLWMIGCSSGARYRMTQALPQTKVMVTGTATVANGWRDLDNYYKMRDLLGMYYMSW